jgi:hypothetical protein
MTFQPAFSLYKPAKKEKKIFAMSPPSLREDSTNPSRRLLKIFATTSSRHREDFFMK